MIVILTICATLAAILPFAVLPNIWDVSLRSYNVARWAIALWLFTLDAALWAGVYWSYQ